MDLDKKEVVKLIIAAGGYLEQVETDVIVMSTDDEDFDEDSESFEEYCDYVIDEAVAEYKQRFAQTMVLEGHELMDLKEKLNQIESLKI